MPVLLKHQRSTVLVLFFRIEINRLAFFSAIGLGFFLDGVPRLLIVCFRLIQVYSHILSPKNILNN